MKQIYRRENLRIYCIYLFFAILFIAVLVRIGNIQIYKKDFYQDMAYNQHFKKIAVKGERGKIYDRRKRLLATNLSSYSVYSDPKFVKDIKYASKTIAQLLHLDEKKVAAKLRKKTRFVWIKRNISPELKKHIESFHIKGIFFIKHDRRYYPQGRLLSHVLGGVDIDNNGIEGVEFAADEILKGKDGSIETVVDSRSNVLLTLPQSKELQKGLDIVLTIDAQIQYWTERFIKETIDKFKAKKASVVVMEPFTGEILALANYPDYDPNNMSKAKIEHRKNAAVVDIFEPGSVFKVVTLVGAVEQNLFKLDDVIFCENGEWKVPGTTLHDYRPYGDLTFKEVFKRSSNIGVAKIAQKLGATGIYHYTRMFGFGKKTGIDIPGEASGLLKPLNYWSNTSPYIIPIGQEIGVTVLQLSRLIAAVVNGGYLVKPHVLKEYQGGYNYREQINPEKITFFSSRVSSIVKDVLISVAQDGTARRANIDLKGIKVGGKTGTAQKFDTSIGRYSPTDYRASFIGFIEGSFGSVVICVTVDEPRVSHFGGVVAAPLFRKIGQKLVGYLTVKKEK